MKSATYQGNSVEDLPGIYDQISYYGLAGLIGMLVAGMLGDWILPFVYNVGLSGFRASMLGWLFLGGLVALEMYATAET